MATRKLSYGTPVTGSGGIHSLATSATFVDGYEWFIIDNTTELAIDYLVALNVMVGTTPTANTEIRAYLIPSWDGTNWPDVFDGTGSAETVTSAGVRSGFAYLAKIANVDATTSNRNYPLVFNVASFFGGVVPPKTGIFITHNTAVNLNSTSGNQTYSATPIKETVA